MTAAVAVAVTLDAAWAAAEAALPDGWRIYRLDHDDAGPGTGWRAIARTEDMSVTWYERWSRGSGATPVAALLDLAARLEVS